MSLNITTQKYQFFTSGTVFYRKRKSLSANPVPQQEEQFFASGTKETVFCIRNSLLHILAKRQWISQSKNTSFLHQEQFYKKTVLALVLYCNKMGKMSMLKNNELYSCVAENKLPNQKKKNIFSIFTKGRQNIQLQPWSRIYYLFS